MRLEEQKENGLKRVEEEKVFKKFVEIYKK